MQFDKNKSEPQWRKRRSSGVQPRTAACALAIILGLFSYADARAAEDPHKHHEKSEGTRPGVVSMDVCADGESLHLLSVSRDTKLALQFEYIQSTDAGKTWSAPVAVDDGQPAPEIAKRGQDVQIAAWGDRRIALWTTRNDESRFGRGPLASSVSSDGGKTWSPGANPADDGNAGDHSFADVVADDQGVFHAVWLDGRNGSKGLIYARSTDGGASWQPNVTLDSETCECCWNTLVAAPGGRLFILYRERDPRDMALIRSDDGGVTWNAPRIVGEFDWKIDACPHVGGGLAISGSGTNETLFAAVWTGRADKFGAYFLRTLGNEWILPRRIGDKEATHTDLAATRNTLCVAWDGYTPSGTAVFAAISVDGGQTWDRQHRLSEDGTTATHPRVTATATGFRVFWTEQRGGNSPIWTSKPLLAAQEK